MKYIRPFVARDPHSRRSAQHSQNGLLAAPSFDSSRAPAYKQDRNARYLFDEGGSFSRGPSNNREDQDLVNIDWFYGEHKPPKTNAVERLQYWASIWPDTIAYNYLNDGEDDVVSITYGQLCEKAKAIAADLTARNLRGERALLLFPPGLDFVTAFFGCLFAGTTPVPAYPPRRNRNMTRIEAISDDAAAKVALTVRSVADRVVNMLDEAPGLRDLQWISTDETPVELAQNWEAPNIDENTLAVLQYTSGSTGTPKGVMLTHANIMHNCSLITHGFEPQRPGCGVAWLPTYHDMGLVGGVLQPMYIALPMVLMSPMAFLQKPIRWLKAISKYSADVSGGPNFAYELCNEKITEEQMEGLDLSTWKLAFNGAEPIRAETLDRFTEKFGPYGFTANAHFPCYGMAETTLIITGARKADPPLVRYFDGRALDQHRVVPTDPSHPDARQLVSCGRLLPDEEIAIVNPDTCTPMPAQEVGEIWVISPSAGKGYWRKEEETQRTFRASLANATDSKTYLRTGDLGFLARGELYVTGRVKDLIIVRGVNRYPQDIEATVEGVSDRLRTSSTAAFAVDVQRRERLVVVSEVERSRNKEWADVISAVRGAIASEHDLPPDAVILVRAGSIPKTSSGKIQRHAVRESFLKDELSVVADWRLWKTDTGYDEEAESPAESAHDNGNGHAKLSADLNPRIVDLVMQHVREVGKERVKDLQPDTNLVIDLGLDSLERLQVANSLEQTFGGRFPDDVLQQIETVEEVAMAIQQHIGDQPLPQRSSLEQTPASSSSAKLAASSPAGSSSKGAFSDYCRFDKMPEYVRLKQTMGLLDSVGAPNPYFDVHDSVVADTTSIGGKTFINFSSYNYLGMSGEPAVSEAANAAIERFGAGVSSSRMYSGELSLHREFEEEVAKFLGVDDAVSFVGGHVTNETTIGHLFGPGDLIVHDALAHNSIIKGCELSGARRRPFAHNDWAEVDQLLSEVRRDYRRVLIAIEGVYSMDGDYPDLPKFIEVKDKHKAFLMVDEAHSFGVLGQTGRGVSEHFDLDARSVDIWMGTLSKSLGSCGGFIAGNKAVVEYLRYTAPGFLFETGLPPAGVAAALASLRLLQEQPERVKKLQENSTLFLKLATEAGLNTGLSNNTPVVPVIIGNSLIALQLSHQLAQRGINVQPIMHPAVEEEKTRLRFFISSKHSAEQIRITVDAVAEELAKIQAETSA